MKESPHEPLSKKYNKNIHYTLGVDLAQSTIEQDKRDTVHSLVWASVVVFGMLALLLHGLAFMSWTEPTMEEIYRNKRIENRVGQLEEKVISLNLLWAETQNLHDNHKHHFWTGKVK